MPAPSPAAILDNPPPLVPANLLNFPWTLQQFPASDFVDFDVTIGNPNAKTTGSELPADRIE